MSLTDPTRVSFHQSLLSLINGKTFGEVRPVLEVLISQGAVDLSTPVETHAYRRPVSFAFAWLSAMLGRNSYASLNQEEIDTVTRWTGNPQWLGMAEGGPSNPASLFEIWMSAHVGSDSIHDTAEPMLASAPLECMLRWEKPITSRGEDSALDEPGAALLSQILQSQGRDVDMVPLLVRRGLSLNVRHGSGRLVAQEFTTPAQWDAYIQQGHPHDVEVRGRQGESPQPLWRFMMENHTRGSLGAHLQQWMSQRDPTLRAQAQQAELDMYWGKVRHAYDIEPAIKSRKDWAELRDAGGENVLMVALQKGKWVAFRSLLKVKKALPLLSDRTSSGLTVWHAMLFKGAPSDVRSAVLSTGVRNDDVNPARGALVRAYVGREERQFPDVEMGKWAEYDGDQSKLLQFLTKANLIHPQWWLAGSAAEQAEVVEALVNRRTLFYSKTSNSSDIPKANRLYSWLAHQWTADGHDLGPAWRGAFCLTELASYRPDLAWVESQLRQGIELKLTDERRALLMDRLPTSSQAVLRQMETLAVVPSSTLSERRSRPRP